MPPEMQGWLVVTADGGSGWFNTPADTTAAELLAIIPDFTPHDVVFFHRLPQPVNQAPQDEEYLRSAH
ncbi:hypothetical protein NON00_02365 [Roseomonas sp. GC11]|uniref:hypothetical protein n=1 Tax=Roseomonas sp. GC11 TaxID=2950546 RepID=UPI00210D86DE|nr:hypothetical protein [Roseomonas sp. GC11]MCQ4158771.1 hypothetical protein [Roseomonas sp. GC11]